jgi:hypothetical protein
LGFFFLGVIGGVLGIIAAAVIESHRPPKRLGLDGLSTVQCASERSVGSAEFECWKCEMTHPVQWASRFPERTRKRLLHLLIEQITWQRAPSGAVVRGGNGDPDSGSQKSISPNPIDTTYGCDVGIPAGATT